MGLERMLPTKDDLIAFEAELDELYHKRKLNVPLHLSGGNEEQLIEIFRQIRLEDWVVSYYRSHYHALLRGMPKDEVRKSVLDGGGMFLMSNEYKFVTSAIAPGQIPIAVGLALAFKRQQSPVRVWAFCGDMAAETGTFYECVKYATRNGLAMTFVVEDNGLSIATPTQKVWGAHGENKATVVRYAYQRRYPHHGPKREVQF